MDKKLNNTYNFYTLEIKFLLDGYIIIQVIQISLQILTLNRNEKNTEFRFNSKMKVKINTFLSDDTLWTRVSECFSD